MAGGEIPDDLPIAPIARTTAMLSSGRMEWQEYARRHHALLFRYALRLCNDHAWAEDLVQEAFLKAIKCQDQLRDPERVQGWLLAIVRNCYLKHVRRRTPKIEADLDQAFFSAFEPYVPNETEPLDRAEIVERALSQLPQEFREVVMMYYFEELSYQDISAATNVPPGTVMSRLHRAKEKLRCWFETEPAQHLY